MAHMFYSQFIARLPYPRDSYEGKTVIVTGSNVGLGLEAARHFARCNASKLILAVRSLDKGQAAKRDIEATNKASKTKIEAWQLDMASYASVEAFATRAGKELDRLDICVANAGVARPRWEMFEDNESTLTVNVVSTFLLTALMLPKMRGTAKQYNTTPTFTITASGAHAFAKFPQRNAPEGQIYSTLNDQKCVEDKTFEERYPLSKMLEIFGVRSIGEMYPNSPVVINCVDPGLCHSELARELDSWGFYFMKLVMARSTEYGSRTLVHAASQTGKDAHGQYYSDCRIDQPIKLVTDAEGKKVQDRLWVELTEKLEKIKPGVVSNFA